MRHFVFYSPQTLPSLGGLQYVVHYWAENMAQRGYRVTVLTQTPDPQGQSPDTGYHTLRNASWWRQWQVLRGADSILMFNVSLKGLPLALFSGRPLFLTHHTALWYPNGPRPRNQQLKQWVANRLAKANCACSGFIADLYEKCQVIYSPYRNDVFIQGNRERKTGSILFAGRLVSDKGADLLIEAFSKLLSEGLNVSLTIAGDGPDRQKLEQLALHCGLRFSSPTSDSTKDEAVTSNPVNLATSPTINQSTITFTGPLTQPDLVHQMQTHEIMVVPSRMEPMGMVVAEGLACGCRMVVSHQGGMPEVGGPFCNYFESGSVESLVKALQHQLSNPLPVSAEALQKHLHQFTIHHSVDELEKWLMRR